MNIYKHKLNGNYYRLVLNRISDVNTYLLVDSKNTPILKNVSWSSHSKEVNAIIIGFSKLIKI